jgi:hypothetical protein
MANAGPLDGDIRATLALSQAEARAGSTRTLNLPGGRKITIDIPAGIQNGEELRFPGQGEPLWEGGPAGDLILTVSIPQTSPVSSPSNPGLYQNAPGSPYQPTEVGSVPSFSSPGYNPGSGSGIPSTSYAPPGNYVPPPPPVSGDNYPQQEPLYLAQDQTAYATPPAYPQYGQPAQQAGYGQYTQPGQQPGYAPQQPTPPPPPRRQRSRTMSSTIIGLIFVLILLLLIGSGLIYYFGVYQPKVLHDQATATANAQASSTALAQAQATSSAIAQATATANAQASATAAAQATANAQASATATALQNILTNATSGTPVLNDPLNAQSSSNWDLLSPSQSTVGASCSFTNGAYFSDMPTKGYFQPCYERASNFNNFAFQVQMNIVQGDEGGILFRANPNSSQFYLFRIDSSGVYDLFLYVDSNGNHAKDLLTGTATAFKTGTNVQNTLTVVAQGSSLYFYINNQYVDSTTNNAYTSGLIGVFGESNSNPTQVAFSNAKVWQL